MLSPAASVTLALSLLTAQAQPVPEVQPVFVRGDANTDGRVEMSDAVFTLTYLFRASAVPACRDALDATDDGRIDISDPILTLGYLFTGAAPLPAPFPWCGVDPSADGLSCGAYSACPSRGPCEDLAAHEIRFEVASTTTKFRGVVRITGTIRNLLGDFTSGEGQQAAILLEQPLGGRPRIVASQPFVSLPSHGEVQVSFERPWDSSSPAEGEFPPDYWLVISYDPDIWIDGNDNNDDCELENNRLERSGAAINELF